MLSLPSFRSSLLLFSQLAFTNVVSGGTVGLGQPSNSTYRGLEASFDHPNATASYDIQGYNVSSPYDSSKTIDGWTVEIAVVEYLGPGGSSAVPATGIKFRAPNTIDLPSTNSSSNSTDSDELKKEWSMCLTVFSPGFSINETISKGQDSDGSCKSFLPNDCIEDLTNGTNWSSSECSPAKLPDSCSKGEAAGFFTASSTEFTNMSDFDGSLQAWYLPDKQDSKENDLYNTTVQSVWLTAYSWGNRAGNYPQPSILCLRAGNATKEDSDSSATATHFSNFGILIVALVVGYII